MTGVSDLGSAKTGSAIDVRIDDAGPILKFLIGFSIFKGQDDKGQEDPESPRGKSSSRGSPRGPPKTSERYTGSED